MLISISTSARDSLIGSMSSPIGATSRFRGFVGLASALLCHTRFRLLSIVHIVGFCGLHFSVQVDIENVVSEINWNKIVLSIPDHQFLEVVSHSLTNFSVNRDHVSIVVSQVEILSPTRAISAALHNTLCTPVSLPFRDRSDPFSSYPLNYQAPPSGIHSPLAVRCNLPSPAPSGPKFNGHVFTAAAVSRCIFTQIQPFRTTHGTKIKTSK